MGPHRGGRAPLRARVEATSLGLLFACCDPALEAGGGRSRSPRWWGCPATRWRGPSGGAAEHGAAAPPGARQRLRERGEGEGGAARDLGAGARASREGRCSARCTCSSTRGYWSGDDAAPIRADLCRLAVGLARALAEVGARGARGARAPRAAAPARRAAAGPARRVGRPRPPARSKTATRWDHAAIAGAAALLEDAARARAPGALPDRGGDRRGPLPRAQRGARTDWREVAALYALLEERAPRPRCGRSERSPRRGRRGAAAGLRCSKRAGRPRTRRWCTGRAPRGAGARRGGAPLPRAGRGVGAERSRARAQIEARIEALTERGEVVRDEAAKEAGATMSLRRRRCSGRSWRRCAREDPRVVEGTLMGGRCARVGEEFLALVDYKGSGLVVRAAGGARRGAGGGRRGAPLRAGGAGVQGVGVACRARPGAVGGAAARGRRVRRAAVTTA